MKESTQRIILLILGIIFIVLMAIAATIYFVKQTRYDYYVFEAPAREENVVTFDSLDSIIYNIPYLIKPDVGGLEFYVCNGVRDEGNNEIAVNAIFGKEEDNINDFYIRLKITDKTNNKVVAQTGLIAPGEWLKNIKLDEELPGENRKYEIRVLTYDKETYESLGTFAVEAMYYANAKDSAQAPEATSVSSEVADATTGAEEAA